MADDEEQALFCATKKDLVRTSEELYHWWKIKGGQRCEMHCQSWGHCRQQVCCSAGKATTIGQHLDSTGMGISGTASSDVSQQQLAYALNQLHASTLPTHTLQIHRGLLVTSTASDTSEADHRTLELLPRIFCFIDSKRSK
jgi:hypothetical protein